MRHFTDEQMIEIGRVRERLEAYRNKVQPYPAEPEEPEATPEPEVEEVIHRHINYNSDVSKKQWHRIDAISGEVKYLRQKHDEMMVALEKLDKKIKLYEGGDLT